MSLPPHMKVTSLKATTIDVKEMRSTGDLASDHFISKNTTAPTVTSGVATLSAESTDSAGHVSAWDNDPADEVEITFDRPFDSSVYPIVVISPANVATAALATMPYVNTANTDNTKFAVACATTNGALSFTYQVVGTI